MSSPGACSPDGVTFPLDPKEKSCSDFLCLFRLLVLSRWCCLFPAEAAEAPVAVLLGSVDPTTIPVTTPFNRLATDMAMATRRRPAMEVTEPIPARTITQLRPANTCGVIHPITTQPTPIGVTSSRSRITGPPIRPSRSIGRTTVEDVETKMAANSANASAVWVGLQTRSPRCLSLRMNRRDGAALDKEEA